MLKRLQISGFRGIGARVDVTLGRFIALVGPNGAGKSSIVDALRLLGDAARLGLPAALDAQGGFGRLRRADGLGGGDGIEIVLDLELPGADEGHAEVSASYGVRIVSVAEHRYQVDWEHARVGVEGNGPGFRVEGGRWSGPAGTAPRIDPENLAIGLVGGDYRFRPLLEAIRGMEAYALSLESLRQLASHNRRGRMERHGLGWAGVLGEQEEDSWRAELTAVLWRLTGDIDDVRVERISGFPIAQCHHRSIDRWIDAAQESDGTLRVAGIMTALLQRPSPTLIALEEPEMAIHPGVLELVLDALREASLRGQVIVTTHSPELVGLLDLDEVRVVTASRSGAQVTPVGARQRAIVIDSLYTLGELLRGEGLEGDPVDASPTGGAGGPVVVSRAGHG